jgi:GDSL-like Lipase/Acylhydrolase family
VPTRDTRRRTVRTVLVGVAAAFATAVSGGLIAVSADAVTASPALALPPCWPTCDPEPPPPPPPTRVHRPGNLPALVVSMGDSYASGEGAPELTDPKWPAPGLCHRSSRAAPAVAVQTLTTNNRRYYEGYQFVHTACTGAGVYDGILSAQAERNELAQITQVNQQTAGRTIDALVISVGGNDVGFGAIVNACVGADRCTQNATVQANWNSAAMALPAKYNDLIDAVQGYGDGNRPAVSLTTPVRDVYVSQYPRGMSTDGTPNWCNGAMWPDPVSGFVASESQWADETVVARLNTEVANLVARANARPGAHPTWHVIPAPDFTRHGFCAGDRWINTFTDSMTTQASYMGTFHPNRTGASQWGGGTIYGSLSYLNL